MKRSVIVLALILAGIIIIGLGVLNKEYIVDLIGLQKGERPLGVEKTDRKVLFYRNPMNPTVTSPEPKKDEMGMDYIPVYEEAAPAKEERKALFYRHPREPGEHFLQGFLGRAKRHKRFVATDVPPAKAEEV